MIVEPMRIGPFGVFTYVLGCEKTREGLVIDPAGEVETILAAAKKHDLRISTVVNTHAHVDHIVGNAELVEKTGAKLAIHALDAGSLGGAFQKIVGLFLHGPPSPKADVLLEDGQKIRMGEEAIEVIHTPGHTRGSVCLLAGPNLFTGDTLFVGAVGRTDLPGGSWKTLVASVREKLYRLPDETIVWPGHDYGSTPRSTIGNEKRTNGSIPGG